MANANQTHPRAASGKNSRSPSGAPRPLKERLAAFTEKNAKPVLYRMPMASVLMGAGLLTNSGYLLWRASALKKRYRSFSEHTNHLYQDWVGYAAAMIEDDDPGLTPDGYTLMYNLLVEPFALLGPEKSGNGAGRSA